MRLRATASILTVVIMASWASAGQPNELLRLAQATQRDEVLDQDWRLNPAHSRVSLTTVKLKNVVETHFFSTLDGSVTSKGDAEVRIDLSSLETHIDIRNVRMRFLFFETFKFPQATVTAHVDKSHFAGLEVGREVRLPLQFTVDLHGVTRDVPFTVAIKRTAVNEVTVTSVDPVSVRAEDFGLTEGVARLSQAMGGIDIWPSAAITFSLAFEGVRNNPELEAVRLAASAKQKEETTRGLTEEECVNRMEVISKTRQIYFRRGSAELESKESAPVLNEVAQFTNRCPSVVIQISGHTDTDGSKELNQQLSEERARAVADALNQRGVKAGRLKTTGYGFSRPVADNTTEEGKQQNRRIEFNQVSASSEAK